MCLRGAEGASLPFDHPTGLYCFESYFWVLLCCCAGLVSFQLCLLKSQCWVLFCCSRSVSLTTSTAQLLFCPVFAGQVGVFNHVNCATAMHRLAKLALPQGTVLEAVKLLGSRILDVLGDFVPQGISNVVWSYATMGVSPSREVWSGLVERSRELLPAFAPQNFANIAWALATLQTKDAAGYELVEKMAVQSEKAMKGFKPQEIGNFSWALMKFGIRPSKEALAAMSLRVCVRPTMP